MQKQSHKRNLILASTSPYRKIVLERLGIPFQICSPDADETPRDNEAADCLVARLALLKAASIAANHSGSVVIGSDQVAVWADTIVGKPGSVTAAVDQLQRFSGQRIRFLTAVCVLCAEKNFQYQRTLITDVRFRNLSAAEITRYIDRDQPLECAGSFKSEAAGISLLSSITSDDPTAIIGLPLIAVSEALRHAGFDVP
jgi:septum formation protein